MKVIFVAPHPDDETLGAGGTILKHRENGDEVFWLIMTSMTEEVGYTKEQIAKRTTEIKQVAAAYGFSKVIELGYPTTKLDQIPISELIPKVREVFNDIKPEIVYLPFRNDGHSDHKKTFDAVYNCAKTFRFPYIKKIMMMEVLSETDFTPPQIMSGFTPNYFVNVEKYMDKKIEIMSLYESEFGQKPYPRSEENLKALASFRGSASNCNFAESFMILKEIW